MIKTIMEVPGLSILKWKKLFQEYKGESISTSTISCWLRGKQKMGSFYKEIFINILCENSDLKCLEETIRYHIMNCLNIKQYQKLYWDFKIMNYRDFLRYVLIEMKPDDILSNEYSWDKISIPVLVDLCEKKTKALYHKLQFDLQKKDEELHLIYMHQIKQEYCVRVGFLFGDIDHDEIEERCILFSEKYKEYILKYLFITKDVSDEYYLNVLKKYNIFLLKIDFYDIDEIKVMENFIVETIMILDESTLHFMNILSEVIVHKICKMNLVVLKEIFFNNYDYKKINEQFFNSNAGLWMYHYPMRRALAFEEKLVKQKLRIAAKEGQNQLRILDINLAGGLLGLRCSFGAGKVTCVDISPGGIHAQKKVVEKYNKVKSEEHEGITNIQFGYLRVDTMKIIGVDIPDEGYDLIILGLGGGSYIENMDDFLRQAEGWLKTGKKSQKGQGVMIVSTFNEEAICFSGSHAKMDFHYEYGMFRHIGDNWPIQATLYTYKEISKIATKHYDLLERYSYPTVLSVVSEDYEPKILEKLKEIDKDYSNGQTESANIGLLHTLYLKKSYPETEPKCYLDTKKYLHKNEVLTEIIQHEEITSRAKMIRELNKQNILAGDNFIKTVVLIDEKYDVLFFFLLSLNKDFKKDYLEYWYKANKKKMVRRWLRFCTETELKNMGLTTGSVSPFSYPVINKNRESYLVCDSDILNTAYSILYTYSGDLNITYKISKCDFLFFLKINEVQYTL